MDSQPIEGRSMATILLRPETLTKEAFSPFGDVIEIGGDPIMINEGTTERFHHLSDITVREGSAIINIFRAQPRQLPMPITMMERHPLGSQAFLPTNEEPYLVLVCEGKSEPDPETLKLFLAKEQGVNYKENCWHHPLLSLKHTNNFWVVDRIGSGNNLEEVAFSQKMKIEIPNIVF